MIYSVYMMSITDQEGTYECFRAGLPLPDDETAKAVARTYLEHYQGGARNKVVLTVTRTGTFDGEQDVTESVIDGRDFTVGAWHNTGVVWEDG
jgi:hypothetical protein